MMVATGAFEVKMVPQSTPDAVPGRMSLDKTFHGDLEGKSIGEMLMIGTATKGSAGYVAIEQVTGTLGGKPGSFALQHSGTMARGTPELSVTVVPDSGTDSLVGLAGRMTIDVAEGKHTYRLEYTLDFGASE
jgi:hypothetical protein